MTLRTASAVISLAKELEIYSAKLYESLAEKNEKVKEQLLSLAKENKKNMLQIERVYFGVISDALEGCFAFNIEPTKYSLPETKVEGLSYKAALNTAVEVEVMIGCFYSEAAEQSESLMADIPRLFRVLAENRNKRKLVLASFNQK